MVAAAIAGAAVAGVAGSVISAGAAKDAASTQSQAALQAANLQHDQYLQTRADLSPFVQTGQAAFNRLGTIFGLNSGGGFGGGFSGGAGTQNTFGTPLSFFPSGQNIPAPTGGGLPQGWSLVPYDTGNGQPTQNLIDQNGNFIRSFAGNATPTDVAAAMGFSLTGQPAQQQQAAQGGGGAPKPHTSADALAAYGLPGLTYDPSRYGLGNGVFDPAAYGLGNGTFKPTQAQLEATPGYQFNLSQGLKSVQNAAAARGQGISGAALKGAAQYATGLADNTLTTQANIYNQNLTNARGTYFGNLANTQGIFQQNLGNVINPLFSYAQLGANAGAQAGNIGANIVNSQSNLLTGAANAQAAGMVGGANAISSGLSSAGNSAMNYLLYNNLLSSDGGGGLGGGTGWGYQNAGAKTY